jgi:hypothetical protein
MRDPTFTDGICIQVSQTSAKLPDCHSSVQSVADKTTSKVKGSADESNALTVDDSDVYDLILTNGKETLKCLLSPSCNHLVQSNKVGQQFVITDSSHEISQKAANGWM